MASALIISCISQPELSVNKLSFVVILFSRSGCPLITDSATINVAAPRIYVVVASNTPFLNALFSSFILFWAAYIFNLGVIMDNQMFEILNIATQIAIENPTCPAFTGP